MNQKDYKEIAGITKDIFDNLTNVIVDYKINVTNAEIFTAYGGEEHKARCMGYDDVLNLLISKRKELANKLADYFEREDDIDDCDCDRCNKNRFNRQYFLIDCGIE